jgi:hypothetical protein
VTNVTNKFNLRMVMLKSNERTMKLNLADMLMVLGALVQVIRQRL